MLSLTLSDRTWAHSVPTAWKLALLILTTIVVVPLNGPLPMVVLSLSVAVLIASLGIPAMLQIVRGLRPIAVLVGLVLAFHIWQDRLVPGLVIAMRIFSLVTLASFVTMTTRMTDMIAVVETLSQPLRRFGLPPRAVGLTVAMVIRFVPVILERHFQLRDAWRARSHRGPRARIIAPLLVSMLDDADHVSDAVRARGGLADL